jgi:hypothetical protein
MKNVMAKMRLDITTMRKKFCGGEDLDEGVPVKHVVQPMPKEYLPLPYQDHPNFPLPPRVPAGFGLEGPTPPPLYSFMSDDFPPSPPLPSFMSDDFPENIRLLKDTLKKKPNWDRDELLDELGISYDKDWRKLRLLKDILKKKPNWNRDELLDELGISYDKDWRK